MVIKRAHSLIENNNKIKFSLNKIFLKNVILFRKTNCSFGLFMRTNTFELIEWMRFKLNRYIWTSNKIDLLRRFVRIIHCNEKYGI